MYDVFCEIINGMRKKGIFFSTGMSEETIKRIEKVYKITFPERLKEFYKIGVPVPTCNESFPAWTDFQKKNVQKIYDKINKPISSLKLAVMKGYWVAEWGMRPNDPVCLERKYDQIAKSAPILIPIYSHHYVPVISGVENPPILSAVGQDIVMYGYDLASYLRIIFLGQVADYGQTRIAEIPFWGTVIADMIRRTEICREKRRKSGLFNENDELIKGE